MKTTTKLALAFTTLATFSGQVQAEMNPGDGDRRHGERMGFGRMSLEKMDADKTGDVTFEEFKLAAGERFVLADTNKDGKVTVEEMEVAIEKVRVERIAKRMIERFDIDGDGALTQAEIETNQRKTYALLDKNNDGRLIKDELEHKKKGWFARKHHSRDDDIN